MALQQDIINRLVNVNWTGSKVLTFSLAMHVEQLTQDIKVQIEVDGLSFTVPAYFSSKAYVGNAKAWHPEYGIVPLLAWRNNLIWNYDFIKTPDEQSVEGMKPGTTQTQSWVLNVSDVLRRLTALNPHRIYDQLRVRMTIDVTLGVKPGGTIEAAYAAGGSYTIVDLPPDPVTGFTSRYVFWGSPPFSSFGELNSWFQGYLATYPIDPEDLASVGNNLPDRPYPVVAGWRFPPQTPTPQGGHYDPDSAFNASWSYQPAGSFPDRYDDFLCSVRIDSWKGLTTLRADKFDDADQWGNNYQVTDFTPVDAKGNPNWGNKLVRSIFVNGQNTYGARSYQFKLNAVIDTKSMDIVSHNVDESQT